MASTGKTVIEATLALVAAAFGLAKTTTTITLIAACARNSGATGISVCKTTTIGTKPAGAATAATKVATTRRVMVVRATAVTAATAKAGVGTGIRKALLGLHAPIVADHANLRPAGPVVHAEPGALSRP